MKLETHLQNKPIWKAYLPAFGVFEREVRRFFAVPAQTILGPLGSSLIYFALFGLALGRFLNHGNSSGVSHNFSYLMFLIPGIMAMESINASVQNPVSSIMVAKWTGTIVDVLMAPISPFSLWIAYNAGAQVRAFLVAFSVFIAGSLCAWQIPSPNIPLIILSLILTVSIFSSLGIIFGILCKSWDQVGIFLSFIMQPLVFFSGVFFSFQVFPSWLQNIRFLNPVFYVVSMFRYSLLGVSDTNPWIAFSVSFFFLLISLFFSLYYLKKGFGLKT